MAEVEDEVIDSQILAEHVGFLDNCFDNSFSLQNSLAVVKEYVAEEQNHSSAGYKNGRISSKKTNTSLLNKSAAIDTTLNKTCIPSQVPLQNVSNKNLEAWGLPNEITKKYEQRGIIKMFDWQVTCLSNSKVLLDGCNLVYSAPTSAGKTLVAEILTIKTILERQKKVIIILPFVSIVREKMFYLQDILSSSGIRVEGFMGSQSPPGGLQAVHIAICTIEKANSLVNRLLDDGNISELGAVIVDELHLLGDPHRGYILELLLTKIKYVTAKSDEVQIQIVGMSATLPNLEDLANWLSAELFVTQFRPIPLDEFCLVGDKCYCKVGQSVNIHKTIESTGVESDKVLNICLDTIKEDCSVLIFCMTKNRCENLAQNLATSFYNLGCQQCEIGSILRKQLNTDKILEVMEQLKSCPVGLDQVLKNTISFGVAYHHAGLTFDERDIIEGGFKSGAIRVLVATSTLSSGVNLPARTVIIRSPVFQRQPINILTYKQMIGRAGRMGQDTKGESILICTEAEKKIGFELVMGALDPVKSCIESGDKYMRAILEMIASQVLCTKAELELYSKCTLLSTQQKNESTSQNCLLESTIDELKNYELVRVQGVGDDMRYVATPLGKACLSASMAPNDGLSLFMELQNARQCLVLETDLHLIYLVTPYSVSGQWGDIDWLHLLTLWESLTKSMKAVGELVGVHESFIIRCLRGKSKIDNAQSKLNIHKRFYTALALQDLVNEVPLSEVAAKFQCARGFLQSLQQAAATFAGMVTAFCHQLGWKNMEILVSQFQDRLHFGINSELLELMKLPSLNGVRSRALFDSGFETVSSIATADANVIENILHKAVPFQSEKEREGDDTGDVKKRNKIKSIWITGYCGMTAKEAAQNLINEARKCLENEIGASDIKWNTIISDSPESSANTITNANRDNPSHNDVVIVKQENESDKSTQDTNLNTKLETHSQYQVQSKKTFDNSSEDKNFSANICKSGKYEITENNNTLVGESINVQYVMLPHRNSTPAPKDLTLDTDLKDEIVWDSLDLNETELNYITKLRKSDKNCSPNLSFGDTDKSVENTPSKSTPVKDVSLFSNDGDNSSLFEESLPLDQIPSKLLGDKISQKQETTADFVSINSNTLLNAFKSTLIDSDEDDDIKLIYEEDNKVDILPEYVDLSNDNEVNCSQATITRISNFKSPDKPSKSKINLSNDNEVNCSQATISCIINFNSSYNIRKPKIDLSNDNEVNCSQATITSISNFKSPYKPRKYKILKVKKQCPKPTKNTSPLDVKARSLHSFERGCSQVKIAMKIPHKRRIVTTDNLEQNEKKKKPNETDEFKHAIFKLNACDCVKTMIEFKNRTLHAIILRGDDIWMNIPDLKNIPISAIYLNNSVIINKNAPKEVIGNNVINNPMPNTKEAIADQKGIAIFLGNRTCIYLDITSAKLQTTLQIIKDILQCWLQKDTSSIKMFCLKTCYLQLKKWLDVTVPSSITDISIAEWLIDSNEKVPNLDGLMNKYCPLDTTKTMIRLDGERLQSWTRFRRDQPHLDACFRAWLVHEIANHQQSRKELNMPADVMSTENHVATILAECEDYGITVDKQLASQMLTDVQKSAEQLYQKAKSLAGQGCINLASSKCVAKLLGIESRGKVSTNKYVLKCHTSPLAAVVTYWRKLNCILTQILFPLTKTAQIDTKGDRILPQYTTHTCTGRISMQAPNLQCVPRTFTLPAALLDDTSKKDARKQDTDNCTGTRQQDSDVLEFNCRNIFVAPPGYVLVSADYCQLEMRILSHFSEDPELTTIMNSDVDVFKLIASSWSNVAEDEVDDELRQKTKQLCYGIIYGMGNSTLAQTLDVSETEAAFYMDSFYSTFPNVRRYTQRVVDECNAQGYVGTLMKRRRYLPNIHNKNRLIKSASERQAVNTTIQGSAADIAKAAMCAIDTDTSHMTPKPRLVLQMHDELIYEVSEDSSEDFIIILKRAMEGTVHLNVPLPVKVKRGYSWGTLKEVDR